MALQSPSKQVRRASYGGSGFSEEGTLNRHDLWRALDELGIQVDGWEADALLDRFAVEDGSEDKVRKGKQRGVLFLPQKLVVHRTIGVSRAKTRGEGELWFLSALADKSMLSL